MPSRFSLTFQDCASLQMVNLFNLHDFIMVVMMMIMILISYILFNLFKMKFYYKFLSEGTLMETVWSIIPALLLIILVFPSMKILYLSEDIKSPHSSIKVVGHQWYWSYVLPLNMGMKFIMDKKGIMVNDMKFDSIMNWNSPRVLMCNNFLTTTEFKVSRLLITSSDVIHSFSIPSLGLKVDSVPGRINQIFLSPMNKGIYLGMCSEICGANHAFMPITMKVLSMSETMLMSKMHLMFMMTKLLS